jgi:hypothetical protein
MIFAQPHRHPVICQEAVLVQHQAIAAAPGLQRREHVGVDAVEEFGCIGSLEFDLAQGRCVKQPDLVAHRQDLAVDGSPAVLARTWVAVWSSPVPDRLEIGIVGNVPVKDGSAPHRQEQSLPLGAGNRTERHRGIGRTKCRIADHRKGLAGRLGNHSEAGDVRRLALVGPHAESGIALGMLHRLISLALGELEVGRCHVVLEIDEVLVALVVFPVAGANHSGCSGPRCPARRRGF